MRSSRQRRLSAAKKTADSRLLITAPVTIQAAAQPEAGKSAGPPTFEALAYSGGVLPGYTANLDRDVVVDLAGMKEARNLVANLDHDRKQRVGHLTKVQNDKSKLNVAGVLSAATPFRDEVANSAKDGFNWEVSMELSLDVRKLQPVPAGESITVNGQTVKGPVYVARKSNLFGLAFTGQGADDGNRVKIAAAKVPPSGGTMNEFEQWLEAKGWDPAEVSEDQKTILKAAFDAEKGRGKHTHKPTSIDDVVAGQKRENERVEKITLLAQTAMKQRENRPYLDQIELLARNAEADNWSPETFELELFRATRTTTGSFRTSTPRDPDARVLEAALCMAAGLPTLEDDFDEKTLDAVDRAGLRHIGIQQLIMQAAHANGYPCRVGDRILPGNLETILQFAFPPATAQLRANFSTVNLPSLLGNVANKEIVAGFAEEDQVWREISVVKPVNNFYTHTVHRLLDDLEYQDLGAGGEIQHGRLGEDTYQRSAKTRAIMLGLSREQIINDDASAFDDLRTRIGRGAARKLNTIFWTAFLDDDSFFTLARGNYVEDTNSTLLVDGVGLEMILQAFDALRTPAADGAKKVGGMASILLHPPELQFAAQRLYQSLNVNTGGAATSDTVPNANIHANKYRPVKATQLSDSAFAGSSSTAWYALRDPRILPAMVVSALGGRVEPTVESASADFNRLGIQFRGYADVGADKAEFLCGVKSKGAA